MPTVLTHPAVPLAIGLGLGKDMIPPRLLIAGVVASEVPDLDVLSLTHPISGIEVSAIRSYSQCFWLW